MTLALLIRNYDVGQLLLYFVGLVLACAIVYAIMRACAAPAWLYTVATVGGLVLLLIVVIHLFL